MRILLDHTHPNKILDYLKHLDKANTLDSLRDCVFWPCVHFYQLPRQPGFISLSGTSNAIKARSL